MADVANLKGQRTNKLIGFGLVVGLNGTGDGVKINTTRRALIALHTHFEQPVQDINELDASNVALVVVEAEIPDHGCREGETADVVVSCVNGSAKSLNGGQLLMTPLLDASLTDKKTIFAVAGGRIHLGDPEVPTRALIPKGATFEWDSDYKFISKDGYVTLVIDEPQARWGMADVIARAINQELASRIALDEQVLGRRRQEAEPEPAVALGPKNVRVRIPTWELARPAWVIAQILQTPLFVTPPQEARVVINRRTGKITVSGNVTILPTVLLIPGLGTVTVGGGQNTGPSGAVGLDTRKIGGTEFQDLLDTLSRLKLSGQQLVETIEQLHEAGALPARLIYKD